MKRRDTAVLFICLLAILSSTAIAAPEQLDPARIEAIGRMLPATPRGVGPTIDDRQAWQAVGNTESFESVVARAEELLSQPMPELTDALFLDYSKTGNRTRCQRVLSDRHGRLPQLVLAECIEATEIKEDVRGGRTPIRLAIDLVEPTETAKITITVTPAKQ